MVVVDASAIVALFVGEPQGAMVETLFFGPDAATAFAAPDIMALEVANALIRRVRRRETAAEDAPVMLARLPRLGIRAHAFGPLLPAAVALSIENRHPVPDCLYLALARAERATALATFDRRLAALAQRLAIPLWPFPDTAPP